MRDRQSARKDNSHLDGSNRREFLSGLAAIATFALLPDRISAQHRSALSPSSSGWIDVHHHFAPPAYADVLEKRGLTPSPMAGWSPQRALDDMDRAGVARAMNSIVGPGVWFEDATLARRLARDANEYAAKLVADHPGRFGSLATLTLPDIEGSLREIEYALDVLKADGITMWTSYGDKWLGDPSFAPIYEELNRRRAVLFVHPTVSSCCAHLLPGISSAKIEYGTDTTRAIARMVYSGASRQYSNLRIIFSHGGGTMPYLMTRFADLHESASASGQQQPDFRAEIAKFYYDTAQTYDRIPMSALKQAVPISQIVFGTDYPYRSSKESIAGLLASEVFWSNEREAIKRNNAATFLFQGTSGLSVR